MNLLHFFNTRANFPQLVHKSAHKAVYEAVRLQVQ